MISLIRLSDNQVYLSILCSLPYGGKSVDIVTCPVWLETVTNLWPTKAFAGKCCKPLVNDSFCCDMLQTLAINSSVSQVLVHM